MVDREFRPVVVRGDGHRADDLRWCILLSSQALKETPHVARGLVQAAAHASSTMVARDGLFTHATFRRINGRCTRGAGNEIGVWRDRHGTTIVDLIMVEANYVSAEGLPHLGLRPDWFSE